MSNYDELDTRIIEQAEYIVRSYDTIRGTAKHFDIPKSTIYTNVTTKLNAFNPDLAKDVRSVLDVNKAERHLRGGAATKLKYAQLKSME